MAAKEVMAAIFLFIVMVLCVLSSFNIGVFITALALIALSSYWAYNNAEWGVYGILVSVGVFVIFMAVSELYPVSADLFLIVWIGALIYFAYAYKPKPAI